VNPGWRPGLSGLTPGYPVSRLQREGAKFGLARWPVLRWVNSDRQECLSYVFVKPSLTVGLLPRPLFTRGVLLGHPPQEATFRGNSDRQERLSYVFVKASLTVGLLPRPLLTRGVLLGPATGRSPARVRFRQTRICPTLDKFGEAGEEAGNMSSQRGCPAGDPEMPALPDACPTLG
jgi:hypothetical protein